MDNGMYRRRNIFGWNNETILKLKKTNKNNKSVKFLCITPAKPPQHSLYYENGKRKNESLKRFMECNSQTSSRDSKAKINFLERNYLIRLNCCLYESASTNLLVLLFFPFVNTNRAAEISQILRRIRSRAASYLVKWVFRILWNQ